MMTRWLAAPHVKAFYQPAQISLDEVIERYGPRLAEAWPTRCHIALSHDHPFAYLQCYRNADWPEWSATMDVEGGLSIDLYIGDADFVGRGFGRAMLAAYVREAFAIFPDERLCYIAHAADNRPALASSQAVGFRFLKTFDEEGVVMRLLALER
jgi:aminoglycoside 6'-N-acetyltransferase